ncbi:unnamed protein product, partial [Ilex paraguariensis]
SWISILVPSNLLGDSALSSTEGLSLLSGRRRRIWISIFSIFSGLLFLSRAVHVTVHVTVSAPA